jgi:hypothetical protein
MFNVQRSACIALARTARQHPLQAATTGDISILRAMNYMGVPADIWRKVFEHYFVLDDRDGGETDAAMRLLSVCKSWVVRFAYPFCILPDELYSQEYIEPWVYFHLYFSSPGHLQRALCALLTGAKGRRSHAGHGG